MFGKKKDEKYYAIKNHLYDISKMEEANHVHLDEISKKIRDELKWVTEHNRAKDQYINTLESKQRTIEALSNALCNKYDKGLFIFSEDGNIPTVIRNGKILTDDLTQSFSINWSLGEFPNIEIEQIAGTHHDMDM